MKTMMMLFLVTLFTVPAFANLPVYLADGSVRQAKGPAAFALGRAIWFDVDLGRALNVPVDMINLEKTRKIWPSTSSSLTSVRATRLVGRPLRWGRNRAAPFF